MYTKGTPNTVLTVPPAFANSYLRDENKPPEKHVARFGTMLLLSRSGERAGVSGGTPRPFVHVVHGREAATLKANAFFVFTTWCENCLEFFWWDF